MIHYIIKIDKKQLLFFCFDIFSRYRNLNAIFEIDELHRNIIFNVEKYIKGDFSHLTNESYPLSSVLGDVENIIIETVNSKIHDTPGLEFSYDNKNIFYYQMEDIYKKKDIYRNVGICIELGNEVSVSMELI